MSVLMNAVQIGSSSSWLSETRTCRMERRILGRAFSTRPLTQRLSNHSHVGSPFLKRLTAGCDGSLKRELTSNSFVCYASQKAPTALEMSITFKDSIATNIKDIMESLNGSFDGANLNENVTEFLKGGPNLNDLVQNLKAPRLDGLSHSSEILERLFSSISGVAEIFSQRLGDIEEKTLSNSSLQKLGGSTAHLTQSARDVSTMISDKLSSFIEAAQGDPYQTANIANAVVIQYFSQLIHSIEADVVSFASQPEVLPFAAIAAGTSIGIAVGNVIAWTLSDEGEMLPSRYDPVAISAYFQRRPLEVLVRFSKIFVEVSAFYSLLYLDKIQGRGTENEAKRARQLVEMIARLGPTAIKVGQALSIRPDLLSLAYLEELQTLQDRVPPFSNAEAQRIIREGLGRDVGALFVEMSSQPVAAASLGQVYRARLRASGEAVAVKVQRPGVLEEISCDLFVLRSCASLLQKLPSNQSDLEGVLDAWARRFFDELDYIQEGKNALRFAENMSVLKNVTVPGVYAEYTSRKVLITEWVEGEKLSESMAADLGSLVTTALNCYLIQLLETGFLHADPHPGNLLRTPAGKLCVLDYGLMTEVTEAQQYALIEYISHLVNNDFEAVAQDLVVLGFIPQGSEDPARTAAVVEPLSRVLGQLVQGGGAKYVNLAQVTDDLARMSQEYTFVIPPYFALILRAFSVLEGIGLQQDPRYSIVDHCYPYISKRLLTDDSPRAREALRYFLYGKAERLNVERVESIVGGFQSFRDLMAPMGSDQEISLPAVPRVEREGVDPTAREALQLVFSAQGSYLQELLLTEVVRSVDALARESQAATWSFFLTRLPVPLPASLSAPGSWPLPLPGLLAGLVRGEWVTARVSEEDQQQLLTVRRLWALLEPELSQTASPASPADMAELGRDLVPLVTDMWPGMVTAGQRFLVMLLQRQALRLADDLDGSNSVALWEEDPAQLARTLQPLWFVPQATEES